MRKSQVKKVDGESDKNTKFNRTLQNYFSISVWSDVYILTKLDRRQIKDATFNKTEFSAGYLLVLWKVLCNDKNNAGNTQL